LTFIGYSRCPWYEAAQVKLLLTLIALTTTDPDAFSKYNSSKRVSESPCSILGTNYMQNSTTTVYTYLLVPYLVTETSCAEQRYEELVHPEMMKLGQIHRNSSFKW